MELGMRNYIEDVVASIMPAILKKTDTCQCPRCRMDIMAYVLNKIPPKYVVTRKGHLYAKASSLHDQLNVDIVTEITKAIEIVSANPRHED